ncbi:RICIN domain-containing protein [Nocardiopsis sp. NPDC049922]|uniref:RICIN domain-containing protein n=1 Tax=Nocardiopsis sp. NPDC049922 TaxID=3155157 RepID=UPI0033D76C3F
MRGKRILGRAAAVFGAVLMANAGLGGVGAHAEASGGRAADRAATSAEANVYRLVNVNSGRCAGVGGSSLEKGAAVIQWDCLDIDDQAWTFVYMGGYHYHLENVNSGQCLTVSTPAGDGARVVQLPCRSHPHQGWRLDKDGQNLRFVNYDPKMNLAVVDSATGNGAPLILAEPGTRASEVWTLIAVG